jgi:hypothetical protein
MNSILINIHKLPINKRSANYFSTRQRKIKTTLILISTQRSPLIQEANILAQLEKRRRKIFGGIIHNKLKKLNQIPNFVGPAKIK